MEEPNAIEEGNISEEDDDDVRKRKHTHEMSELSKLEIHPPISNNLLPEKSEMSVHLDNGIGSMSEVEELKQGFNNVGRERSFSGNVNNLKSTDSLAKR